MTTNFQELINEVELNLSGYTANQERVTHLTQLLTNSGLSLNLASVSNIGKGIVQIEDELLYVDSYDRISSTATVAPYGRGYQGTSAVQHAINTKVTVAPTFPRVAIKKAINDTIQAVYPQIWGVGRTTFTFVSTQTTYALPADAQTVLYASWQTTGPSDEWMRLKGWRVDPMANTTQFPTGNTISVYDRITPGRTIQVVYSKVPTALSANGDVFETVTGLPSSCKDIIIYGASYRLLSFVDPGRLNYNASEADLADTKLQYGSAAATARYLRTLYTERLAEEAGKLRDFYPINIHYTRY